MQHRGTPGSESGESHSSGSSVVSPSDDLTIPRIILMRVVIDIAHTGYLIVEMPKEFALMLGMAADRKPKLLKYIRYREALILWTQHSLECLMAGMQPQTIDVVLRFDFTATCTMQPLENALESTDAKDPLRLQLTFDFNLAEDPSYQAESESLSWRPASSADDDSMIIAL